MRLLLPLLLSLLPLAAMADPQDDLLPVEQAFALSASAPERGRIEFTWKIADGYYLYRHRINVSAVSSDFKTNPIELPEGEHKTDPFFGEVQTYRGSVTAVQTGAAADGVASVQFVVGYQGCADIGICYPPHRQTITVTLPAGTSATGLLSATPAVTGSLFAGNGAPTPMAEDAAFRVEAALLDANTVGVRFQMPADYYVYRDKITFAAPANSGVMLKPGPWPAAQTINDDYFGEQAVYFDEAVVPVGLLRSNGEAGPLALTVTFQGCLKDVVCYPPITRSFSLDLPASTPSTASATPGNSSSASGLLGALLAALLGGLILNLMPCVLPVLALKALGVANSGESAAKARAHALWYSAGVLLSFATLGAGALALREAGLALGWGFQLQQPAVVGALSLLMFAIGLSLSGVFNIGGGLANVGGALAQKSGPTGDFFTGVLAVVVAAPCTAPFMGAALAYAFAASPVVAIGVFLALGLGLALPFLLIGFVPGLAQRLPKPGAWMDTLKNLLAFPMYLTAAWLAWVLAKQRGADAIGWLLIGAIVLALGLWAWERSRFRATALRGLAMLIAALGIAVLWPIHAHTQRPDSATAASTDGSEPWSEARLAALRSEGRVVFVNMTADWCVTCKANERTVLATDGFVTALNNANAVYLKGDWTDVDPAITAYLQQHGAVGVPFYAVYPASGGEPAILPNLLTLDVTANALREAAAK